SFPPLVRSTVPPFWKPGTVGMVPSPGTREATVFHTPLSPRLTTGLITYLTGAAVTVLSRAEADPMPVTVWENPLMRVDPIRENTRTNSLASEDDDALILRTTESSALTNWAPTCWALLTAVDDIPARRESIAETSPLMDLSTVATRRVIAAATLEPIDWASLVPWVR